MFQEKTWEEVTTPDERGFCPVEGECGPPNEARRIQLLNILENVEAYPNVHFLVFVQCQMMDSSHFGSNALVMAGPKHTWTAETIEELKQNPNTHWYGDLPSQRMQPQWFISRESHLKVKELVHA